MHFKLRVTLSFPQDAQRPGLKSAAPEAPGNAKEDSCDPTDSRASHRLQNTTTLRV